MVTLSGPTPSPAQDHPHRHRDLAESFGADADRYDRTRPDYPEALARAVLAGLPGRQILDVGIGTGLSAQHFRAAGCEVLGVEVDPRMAEAARRRGYAVEVARFEDWIPRGRLFDAVIAGQTWHWVDPVAGAAQAARVLRPDGRLAIFWNVGEPPADIAASFARVYRSVLTGLPFTPWTTSAAGGYAAILDTATDGIRRTRAFTDPQQRGFDWATTVTRDRWLEGVPTSAGHHRLPRDQLQALLDGMGQVIDAAGGAFEMRYTTITVTVLRRAGGPAAAPGAPAPR